MPAAPIAANLLAVVWAHGQTQKLIDLVLERLEGTLAEKETVIRDKVGASSSRWIPRWVDSLVAGKVMNAVSSVLSMPGDGLRSGPSFGATRMTRRRALSAFSFKTLIT